MSFNMDRCVDCGASLADCEPIPEELRRRWKERTGQEHVRKRCDLCLLIALAELLNESEARR